MPSQKLKVAVLISGGGSNLQSLIDAGAEHGYPAEIVCVISNRADAYGLVRAKDAEIPAIFVPSKGRTQEEFEAELQKHLIEHEVDLICLAGFMRILSAGFITSWEDKILNIHPALLPKFGGEGMYGRHVHRAVIEAGERESGASVHIVTQGVDEGPIILQKSVLVKADDTPEILAKRVLAAEHEIYSQALRRYAAEILLKTS